MGNESSRTEKRHSHHSIESSSKDSRSPKYDAVVDQYFTRLADSDNSLSFSQLVSLFDQDLAESLWKYFTGHDELSPNEESMQITREEFNRKFTPLYGTSTDIYVKILQPVYHFIKVCSDAAGAPAIHGDEGFIKSLVEKMTTGSTGEQATTSILDWRRTECERFCNAVQSKIVSKVAGQINQESDYSSDILTPLQMWYLQCSLPNIFFPPKSKDDLKYWTPLYTSLQHGISTNRFETLVFDYKGPTVTIMRLKDKRIVALALDQEWRNSGSKYGGTFTTFFEISPHIQKLDGPNSLYCNLKLRSSPMEISFKHVLKIDKEFNEVLDIEVWGCAGATTLSDQQKLKNWQKHQAEKHKKVPLPGNWDDNPDKTLLELAGFQFSNERKQMEMESKQRQDNQIHNA